MCFRCYLLIGGLNYGVVFDLFGGCILIDVVYDIGIDMFWIYNIKMCILVLYMWLLNIRFFVFLRKVLMLKV